MHFHHDYFLVNYQSQLERTKINICEWLTVSGHINETFLINEFNSHKDKLLKLGKMYLWAIIIQSGEFLFVIKL